jgi:glycosyltransferase involved in cell wall biosynthesis
MDGSVIPIGSMGVGVTAAFARSIARALPADADDTRPARGLAQALGHAPRVCLFVEFMYPVVSNGRVPFAGGIEVQLAHLGRGLALLGFDVRAITCDYGQPDLLDAGGVLLHKAYPPEGGLPVLRFFHPRLTRGLSTLWSIDADVYCFSGAAMWAGLVHAVARARGRSFVWLTAHDHDVRRELPDVHGLRDRWLVRRAMRGADAIVAQTQAQRQRLKADFGLDSNVIMNPVEIPPERALRDVTAATELVWLSTYKPSKRPEWFTRFAERHPNVPCRMAGIVLSTATGQEVFRQAQRVAERHPNLTVQGTVPHERIGEVLERAALFAHSSAAEGFPNTLLECWGRGVPSVSAFDPDGIVEREGLGACRTEYAEWEAAIERRLADPALRRTEGARARAWVIAHHAPELIHREFAGVLLSLFDTQLRDNQPPSSRISRMVVQR